MVVSVVEGAASLWPLATLPLLPTKVDSKRSSLFWSGAHDPTLPYFSKTQSCPGLSIGYVGEFFQSWSAELQM